MNGWIKYFQDGSREVGSDVDVRLRKASWTRGRLVGMKGVSIGYQNNIISLNGQGDFWQSDDYEALVHNSSSVLKVRRIQKKIMNGDDFFYTKIHQGTREYIIQNLFLSPRKLPPEGSDPQRIPYGNIGKWLTIEYDIENNTVSHSFRDDKI